MAAARGGAVTGRWLGLGIGNLVNLLNPEVVVLGGMFQTLHPHLREAMMDAVRRQSLDEVLGSPRGGPECARTWAQLHGAAELGLAAVLADPTMLRAACRLRSVSDGQSDGTTGPGPGRARTAFLPERLLILTTRGRSGAGGRRGVLAGGNAGGHPRPPSTVPTPNGSCSRRSTGWAARTSRSRGRSQALQRGRSRDALRSSPACGGESERPRARRAASPMCQPVTDVESRGSDGAQRRMSSMTTRAPPVEAPERPRGRTLRPDRHGPSTRWRGPGRSP